MSGCKEQKGGGRLGTLITILVLAAGVWASFQVMPFWLNYSELKNLMEAQAAKASVFSDHQIRKNILGKIKELELPIDDPDDVKINRFDGRIVIETEYEEVLFLDLGEKTYDIYVFKFHPVVEHRL